MRVKTFGRLRRRNPLRRRSDVLQAWAGLVAVVLMVLGGTAAGWVTGSLADRALRQTVREQQRHRHPVVATTLRVLPAEPAGTEHESAEYTAVREGYRRVLARWSGPDGRPHSGTVAVRRSAGPGEPVPQLTDHRGRVA
ncbi:hypothetical protein AB0K09_07355, partial [Streptomyces sp. NPDC049577]